MTVEQRKITTNLAETYYQAERFAEALKLYEKILKYNPQFPFHLRRAKCLAKVGRKEEGIEALTKLKKIRLNRRSTIEINEALSEMQ